MRDHDPIDIEEFNGLWARGDAEPCPLDHFTECINIAFVESGYKTRNGLNVIAAMSNVLRVYPYNETTAGDGFLVLLNDNKIYHLYGTIGSFTTFQVSNAITGMTDFAFVALNTRAYISPGSSGNIIGLAGELIYVYDGLGVNMMRPIAGTAPTTAEGALAVANSATAGNVEAGIHVFGVVYETNSGFLTQIGPPPLAVVTATGAFKVDASNIPIYGGGGGTLITKRHLVASKLIDPTVYTGDRASYQLFFVPSGTISNNTATTLTVNFYDSELIEDASHLLDLNSTVVACGGLGTYKGRMIGWNFTSGADQILVSYPNEPEAFDVVSGFIVTPHGINENGITQCQEYRDILYIFKPNKIMAASDNGDVPTSWSTAYVDTGLGCGKHGIAVVGSSGGTNIESFIVINYQGVYMFSGSLITPELSYKIKDFWLALVDNEIRVGSISIVMDPVNQLLYINIPSSSMVLIGDYTCGLTAEKIKWSKWTFGAAPATIMLFDTDNKLFMGLPTGVHYIKSGDTADTISGSSAVKIPDPTATSALVPNTPDDNLYHVGGARIRVVGSGNLIPKYYGLDAVTTQTLASIAMSATPGKEPLVLANLVNQQARLELKTSVINETFKVNRLTLFLKSIYTAYPM